MLREILKSKKTNKEISTTRRGIILFAKEISVSISKAIGVTKPLVSNANIGFLKADEEIYEVYYKTIIHDSC